MFTSPGVSTQPVPSMRRTSSGNGTAGASVSMIAVIVVPSMSTDARVNSRRSGSTVTTEAFSMRVAEGTATRYDDQAGAACRGVRNRCGYTRPPGTLTLLLRDVNRP
ncbi:Uncharacterised protein [Mycobacteroides abscessus subsp. abscessus]|nr:Uncharacterised protein [Mycobacteroides abscessus subsp. abscessus]